MCNQNKQYLGDNMSTQSIKQTRKIIEESLSDLTIQEYYMQVVIFRSVYKQLSGEDEADITKALGIIETSMTATGTELSDFDAWDFNELLENTLEKQNTEDDFYLELPCGEVRVIDKEEIDQIWHDSLIEQIKKCYDLDNIPSFIEIDWDKTAENCKVDGKGHHFASYDYNEHETDTHEIFRIN